MLPLHPRSLRRAFPRATALALPLALLPGPLALGAPPKRPPAAGAAAEAAAPALDLGPMKDRLVVLGDGKQHLVAVVPFGEGAMEQLYYGDGKRFWKQRVVSGGSSGTESFERTFWEPRVDAGYKASIDFRSGKYVVQCDERKTELSPLPEAERAALLGSATFHGPRWNHRAYALARDNLGKYYYVDKVREPPQSKVFRLYVGMKGNLKLQKMINVVSDSEGDIFATRSGSLRLILDKHETTWVAGKQKTALVSLPVEDNHVLIYTDLGAYTGERLGTPCDDL
jgi:hypothetical protein